MATTQLAAKNKLKELLELAEDLSGIQISFGHPGKNIEDECIVLGGIYGNSEVAAMGTRKRDEDYTINCAVSIVDQGDDQEWTTTRAYELYAVVEAVLQAFPTLDGLSGLIWALVTAPTNLREGLADGGRVSDLSFGIQCKARI